MISCPCTIPHFLPSFFQSFQSGWDRIVLFHLTPFVMIFNDHPKLSVSLAHFHPAFCLPLHICHPPPPHTASYLTSIKFGLLTHLPELPSSFPHLSISLLLVLSLSHTTSFSCFTNIGYLACFTILGLEAMAGVSIWRVNIYLELTYPLKITFHVPNHYSLYRCR